MTEYNSIRSKRCPLETSLVFAQTFHSSVTSPVADGTAVGFTGKGLLSSPRMSRGTLRQVSSSRLLNERESHSSARRLQPTRWSVWPELFRSLYVTFTFACLLLLRLPSSASSSGSVSAIDPLQL